MEEFKDRFKDDSDMSKKHIHHDSHEDMKHTKAEHQHLNKEHTHHEEHNHHMHHEGHNHEHTGHEHSHEGHAHGHAGHHAHMVADFKKRFFISTVLTIPLLILSPLIQKVLGIREALSFGGDLYVLWALATFIFFYGGYPFLKGFYDEMRARQPGMMTLISIAITVAYLYSSVVVFGLSGKIFFWELATLIDIMLLGHWLEMKSVMSASRALEKLASLMPQDAHKLMPDGSIKDVPLSQLKPGDVVVVKPGERIPADGVVIDGETSVNESMLTGESVPVSKKKGDKVIGGSINGEGSIKVKIEKTGKDSFLAQVIELVKKAQESKSKTQSLADRAAVWLTIIALTAGGITFLVWTFWAGKDVAFSLERTVTVMVITCPHALGLAIPLVVAVSSALAAAHGFLIRNRTAFEQARDIQAVVFDKTGTLTEGRFGVSDVVSFSDLSDDEILKYAASLESRSEHSIAKAIASSTKDLLEVEEFRAIPGKGAEGRVGGKFVQIVSPGFLKEQGIEYNDGRVSKLFSEGKTVVFVLIDGDLKGAIALSDRIRDESKEAVLSLKKMGIKSIMLTGDNKKVAEWVAKEIGVDEYFAEVLPQEKSEKIKEIQKRGLVVAMVGDGINDAPALVQADVGIAIGAGTDVAIESADIVLVKNDPRDVVNVIRLARLTYGKMVQNLMWATGYNLIAIPLAAGVLYGMGILLSPAAGAVLMSLSTVIVAINAKLLKLN